MKRTFCLLLSALMAFTMCCSPAFAVWASMDERDVMETAESYLSERMEAVYLRSGAQTNTISTKTLLDIGSIFTTVADEADLSSSASPMALSESAKTFLENESAEIMESLGRSSMTTELMVEDLQAMENYVAYRSHIFEDMDIEFASFDARYYFDDVVIYDDYAVVKVYESLNYQYIDSPDDSSELNHYYLALKKIDGLWYIADVVSDDAPYLAFLDDGLTADEAIAGYESAIEIESETVNENWAESSPALPMATTSNIGYNVNNAVNYALMYTSTDDNPVRDGGNGTTSTPTFKNLRFKWFNADCMNFASQCVWAGFGGSNNYSHVGSKYGMDNSGSYKWWCTRDDNTDSWSSCSAFYTYFNNSNSSTEKGLHGDTKVTAYNSSTINWDYAASDLVGSVMQVRGKDNSGNWKAAAHAVFVNAASSLSRSDIFVCCYNTCKKNVKLGTYWPAGNDETYKVITIKPRSFIQGSPSIRVWGDWVTNVTATTVSRTLKGYGNQAFETLTMKLMNPDGGVVKTWTAENASSVSGTYANWNSTGDKEWIIEVAGTTSAGTIITWNGAVRVCKKS